MLGKEVIWLCLLDVNGCISREVRIAELARLFLSKKFLLKKVFKDPPIILCGLAPTVYNRERAFARHEELTKNLRKSFQCWYLSALILTCLYRKHLRAEKLLTTLRNRRLVKVRVSSPWKIKPENIFNPLQFSLNSMKAFAPAVLYMEFNTLQNNLNELKKRAWFIIFLEN